MTLKNSDVEEAADFLDEGELVAIPTETVYGLAANAFDERAVRQIFEVKNRPFYDPLILHTDSIDRLISWGIEVPEGLTKLANRFWPGPLTLLVDHRDRIPPLVTAGMPRVAFRVPNHPLSVQLLRRLSFPVAAPSANPFGYVSPTSADHVMKHFDGKIAMVLDGGPCEVGIESTIVGMEDDQIVVYRLGGTPIESIEKVVGPVEVKASSSRPEAPGMLQKHYAPGKKVHVVESQEELDGLQKEGSAFILFRLDAHSLKSDQLVRLSESENDEEAASKFYDALQSWDEDETIEKIIVERLPNLGLGRAINDRLRRAQH